MTERPTEDQRQMRTFKTLLWLAGAAAIVAAIAGIVLLVADPAEGSSSESTLGFTAAAAGLLTGLLAGAAAIYAQVKNLWRFVPTWGRVVAWVVIIAGVVYGWFQGTN